MGDCSPIRERIMCEWLMWLIVFQSVGDVAVSFRRTESVAWKMVSRRRSLS